jgi:hypothetical protein
MALLKRFATDRVPPSHRDRADAVASPLDGRSRSGSDRVIQTSALLKGGVTAQCPYLESALDAATGLAANSRRTGCLGGCC